MNMETTNKRNEKCVNCSVKTESINVDYESLWEQRARLSGAVSYQ